MKVFVFAALIAVVLGRGDVGLGYQYNVPASSYGVPTGARLGSGQIDTQFFPINQQILPNFGVETGFQAPIFGPTSFTGYSGPAVRLQTESPAYSFANINLNNTFESVTPKVSLNGLVTGSGLSGFGIESSTALPQVTSFSNIGDNSFGVTTPSPISTVSEYSFPSSTFAPQVSGLGLGSGFQTFGYSTPQPIFTDFSSVSPNFGSFSGDYSAVLKSAEVGSQQGEVQKSFYFFTSPEEEEEIQQRITVPVAPPQKRYKVIFIKAPTYSSRKSIEVPVQQNEEKTLVYVLVKKPEDNTDVHVAAAPPTPPSKPEVFFIKYKTQKEAEEAVSRINQGQYTASLSANSVQNAEFINSLPQGKSGEGTIGVTSSSPSAFGGDVSFNSRLASPVSGFQQFTTTTLPSAGLVSGIEQVSTPTPLSGFVGFNQFSNVAPAAGFRSLNFDEVSTPSPLAGFGLTGFEQYSSPVQTSGFVSGAAPFTSFKATGGEQVSTSGLGSLVSGGALRGSFGVSDQVSTPVQTGSAAEGGSVSSFSGSASVSSSSASSSSQESSGSDDENTVEIKESTSPASAEKSEENIIVDDVSESAPKAHEVYGPPNE